MSNITKGCPACGAILEIRANGWGEYLICTRPGCKRKERLPVDLVLRRLGATPLPGLAEVAR
jgi:hypothetical protein